MEIDSSILELLSDSEQNVLAYIQSHPLEMARMSVQDLAEAAFVSTATIIRLCKKLNLDGFNDLKYGMKQTRLRDRESSDSSLEFRGIISNHLSVLRRMVHTIDLHLVDSIVDHLCKERNLYLFARGMSYMPVNYMYQVLLSVDKTCVLYIDPPLMYNAAMQMEPDDMTIIASSGGATKEVLKAAEMVHKSGATVAVLSSSQDTVLKETADIFLYCPTENRSYQGVDIKSRFTIAFVIELILNGYLSRMKLNPPSDPDVYIKQKN